MRSLNIVRSRACLSRGDSALRQLCLSSSLPSICHMPRGAVQFSRKAEAFDSAVLDRLTPTLSNFTLQGKTALITGGARSLGWNMAQGLAEAGASGIAIVDQRQKLGEEAASELAKTTKIPVRFYEGNVTDEDAMAKVVGSLKQELGSVDIVINSAGVVDSNLKAEQYDTAMFRRLMDINLTGSFIVSQAAARIMMEAGRGGSIIFLSSIAGSRVLHPQEQCAYNASKAAVTQLARSLAAEWAQHSIRVNTVAPGYMDTALNKEADLGRLKSHWAKSTPMRRLGKADELNGVAVFLASDASRFMTGAHIYVDGGYSVF